jgi:ABC-type nitrate/sulfonate/bicarbonate transport system substrate-binding protein
MSLLLPRRALLAGALAAPLTAPAIGRAQPLRRVDLLLDWKAMPTYCGFYLASEWGLFAGRGLDVAIHEGSGAVVSAAIVAQSSEYWIGSSSGAATAISRSRGLALKSLTVLYHATPSVIFSRAETGIVVPTDLYGKRLGLVPGSTTVDEFRALLAVQHLDPSRITVVDVEAATSVPLYDGRVDALIDYAEMLPAELQSAGRQISILGLAACGVRLYSLNVIAKESMWVSPEGRDTATRLVEAVLEAYSRVQAGPAVAVSAFTRIFRTFEQPYMSQAMAAVVRQLGRQPLGQQTRLGWQATLDQLGTLGLLHRPVTVDEVAGDLS